MIIDTHFHLFKEFYSPYSYAAVIKDVDKIVERLFGRGKLEQAWLLASRILNCGAQSEEVLEISKKYPDLFIPFGYLNFNKGVDIIDELKEKGFRGLGEVLFPPKPFDDESLFPFYERAEALKMIILFHTGSCWIFPPGEVKEEFSLASQSTAYHRPQAIGVLAKHFPKLRMIIGHAGCPWHLEAAEIAKNHPHVYLEISGYPDEVAIRDIMASGINPDQILFGSDYPVYHPLERLSFWERFFTYHLKLNEQIQQGILGENAQRLLLELED